MSRFFLLTFFVLLAVSTMAMSSEDVRSRSCGGIRVFERLQRVCGMILCIDQSGDLATTICGRGLTDLELMEMCCPQ
ncbi:hypothetical protein L5515_002419 [Caenorhabditis briggsae]|uniref:INSulin related n=1 Tax=Caenorhabditis briggsae TaxID=6238 RepID=A0AAE9J4U5_CAEBR|nr:hypothetical protein L5515_002419 [Caenorhabditis briggsae]